MPKAATLPEPIIAAAVIAQTLHIDPIRVRAYLRRLPESVCTRHLVGLPYTQAKRLVREAQNDPQHPLRQRRRANGPAKTRHAVDHGTLRALIRDELRAAMRASTVNPKE